MKLRILTPAIEDLAAGRAFYDHQSPGVGTYFFDSLFAEIDSLVLYAGRWSALSPHALVQGGSAATGDNALHPDCMVE